MRRTTGRTLFLRAALLAGLAGAASADSFGIDVKISLSPEAARRLTVDGEGMVVAAWWYGEPNPAGMAHVDAIGRIDLGDATVEVPGQPGSARLGGPEGLVPRLAWVDGPVWVNINIWSARRSGPDNILDCDFFDGELAHATARPIALRCALIGEGYQSRALN
jgi:hypothetical protein